MKKKISLFALVFVSVLLLKTNVYAATTCSTSEKKELVQEASLLEYSYELVEDNSGMSCDEFYYTITIGNYSDKFFVSVGSGYFNSSYVNSDGDLKIPLSFSMGQRVTFTVYASSETNCEWTKVATKTIKFPYYNKYSTYEECVGYEDLDICKSTTNVTNITTDEEFLSALESAKIKAAEEAQVVEEIEDDENIIEKAIDYYLEYKLITIPVTVLFVLLIVVLVVIIIRKRKNKVKVNLGRKL